MILIYGTTHAVWYDVDAELTANNQSTIQTPGWSWQYGQSLGVEMTIGVGSFKIEAAVARGSFRDSVSRTDQTFGASGGLKW